LWFNPNQLNIKNNPLEWGSVSKLPAAIDFLLSRMYKKKHVDNNESYDNNSLNDITAEVEKEKIIKVLIEAKGNKSYAAKLLNIDRSSLYNKLKKYEIDI